ncbi:MAG: hypothetical protein JWO47_454 [Candidatus Saccharibacteria bacterium]|nr:hypothetical protein [Candidatus Saccharibacteria bacterium]
MQLCDKFKVMSELPVYDRDAASQMLVDLHSTVIAQIGLSHDNFSGYFDQRVSSVGVNPSHLEHFTEYYKDLSRPLGYLCKVFDAYRKDVDPKLAPPGIPLTSAKANLIWTLASVATGEDVIRKSNPDIDVWGADTTGVAMLTLWKTKRNFSLAEVSLKAVGERGVIVTRGGRHKLR